MIRYNDDQVTAKEFTKLLITDGLDRLEDFWAEHNDEVEDMSTQEEEHINEVFKAYRIEITKLLKHI